MGLDLCDSEPEYRGIVAVALGIGLMAGLQLERRRALEAQSEDAS